MIFKTWLILFRYYLSHIPLIIYNEELYNVHLLAANSELSGQFVENFVIKEREDFRLDV